MDLIQKIFIWAVPVIFAVTFHEISHGWVASLCGDKTAQRLGRLSPNPLRHVDPMGTVLVPGLLFFLGGFIFGWAKPVPIDWRNLKRPKLDMALVALAGPAANLVMAMIWAIIMKLALLIGRESSWVAYILLNMGLAGILINVMLLVFNLIPIPPLDGSRVVSSLLPPELSCRYDKIERYGLIILLILLATGILSHMLLPMVRAVVGGILAFFGIPWM